jgi:hypothetical protein
MIETRLLDYDPATKTTEWFHYDHSNDTYTIERVQEVDDIVEQNKALQNDNAGGWRGDMHHVASIPLEMLVLLEKKGIISSAGRILDQAKLKAWLNDSTNRFFRTRPGRV